jgi:hypothetical protein
MALKSLEGEPDFKTHPSIPPVEMTIISRMRSGQNAQPEEMKDDLEADKNKAGPSQRGRGD